MQLFLATMEANEDSLQPKRLSFSGVWGKIPTIMIIIWYMMEEATTIILKIMIRRISGSLMCPYQILLELTAEVIIHE